MAYRAPFWLWTRSTIGSADSDDDEEANALLPPVTPEEHILKQMFMDAASSKYKMFAFEPEALLARRMYGILREGVHSKWALDAAEEVLREWDALHPEDGIVVEEEDSSSEEDSEAESDAESDDGSNVSE
jgi:hypothetical protein